MLMKTGQPSLYQFLIKLGSSSSPSFLFVYRATVVGIERLVREK